MPARVAFVYQAATAGGVERVFLNRGEALLRRYPELEIEVYFYQDWGGAGPFAQHIRQQGLSGRFRVVPAFEPGRYSAIFPVDTPQVVLDHPSIAPRLLFECHTPYPRNRAYLQEWQHRLERLIVPSSGFGEVIAAECPALAGKITVVRNFVPIWTPPKERIDAPAWTGPVFLHFGRIDTNKNVTELLDALDSTRQANALVMICGQVDPGFDLAQAIDRRKLRARVLVLPPVPFARGRLLLQLLRERRGVFVSCSKGESFGLSAAEAMTAGLPVILSDIAPHATLVGGRREFLYPLGDVRELALKMAAAIDQYERLSSTCVELAKEFSEEAFLTDWQRLAQACHAGIV